MDLHVAGRVAQIRYADRHRARTAWGVDRRTFDARLAAHAASSGAELREGVRVVGLVEERGRVRGVHVRDADGSTVTMRAGIVVGADGARSTVARLAGVERPVGYPRRLGLVAHYMATSGLSDHGEMHVGDGYYVGLAPTPGDELNVGMALPLEGRGSAEARFEAALAGLPNVVTRLQDSRRVGPIRGAAPIGHRVAAAAGPGWLLVGDAAGFLDPFTGEGLHRALVSAELAAAAILALRRGRTGALDAYARAMQRRFLAKDGVSWLVQAFLTRPALFEYAARRLAARAPVRETMGLVIGDLEPAARALDPRYLAALLRP